MKEFLEDKIKDLIEQLQLRGDWDTFEVPKVVVERPRDLAHGDWMTNIALVLAKEVKKSPREVAQELCDALNEEAVENIKSVDIAGPGFINFRVTEKYLQTVVENIIEQGENYGNNDIFKGKRINNEFISANPTGPLHLGNGRGGFLGDVITNVLAKSGADIVNEYYLNDAGEQVIKLGHSVLKDDEKVYGGEYIDILNEELQHKDINTNDVRAIGEWAANEIVHTYLKRTTQDIMNIQFDNWISEKKDIVDAGFVDRAIEVLEKKELVFEKDDAKWLRTTDFGDDKDRVLVKSDGERTYFASDCGYILNKMERGFDELIEIWGADHHGYVTRFEAAARAIGFEGKIKFIMVQLVRLVKDGKEVRMSKRAGNVVYIDDLISEVGHDVARFFFLMQSIDSHMDFDLDLAKEKSSKNPVHYVQYAYARLSSILVRSEELSIVQEDILNCDIGVLTNKKELELMRELEIFEEIVADIANTYYVHQLPHYAIELAEKFHSFYTECKVIDESDINMTRARLKLLYATKSVIAQTLNLIGVDAPEKM